MAGGRFAQFITCTPCAFDGVVTRAERVRDGVETDHYRCAKGHGFGVDWRRNAPTTPQWPPAPAEVVAIESTRPRPVARPMVPDTVVRRFVPGIRTRPADELLRWLDAQTIARLRLPVLLVRGPVGFSLRAARIGGDPDGPPIYLDDSALGVALTERARQAYGDSLTCALWLEGNWHGGVDHVFLVLKSGPPIAPDDLAVAMAEIEAPAE